jgi:hypothetical protein
MGTEHVTTFLRLQYQLTFQPLHKYTHPSIYELQIYEFLLQRTTHIYTYFSFYEHYFRYNEEPTFVRGPSACFLSNERGGIRKI